MNIRIWLPTFGFIAITAILTLGAQTTNAQPAAERCGNESGDAAIAACDEAIRRNPKNSALYNFRGSAWYYKSDYDKAIADFSYAIKLSPKIASIYSSRGSAWESKGDYDKALVDFNYAIKLDPNLAFAYYGRGILWRKKGDYDKALADYDHAIRLNPKFAYAYHSRGLLWYSKGDYDKAFEDIKEAVRLDPNYEIAKGSLINILAHKKVLEEKTKWQPAIAQTQPQQQAVSQAAPQQTPVAAIPSGARVALIIGNSKYIYSPLLENPNRDAQLLAAALRNVGFQSVTVKIDLTREGTIQTLRDFANLADSADWAVVYYSGHGIEFGGANYMIPVDAQLRADRDIDLETVNVGQVMNTIEGAKRLRLVVLDACRDNPFASQMRRTMATRSMGKGLARIEPEAGTLVVYAAKHGETALDGAAGSNSPFVEAMVRRIQQRPPLEVRRLFDVVRDDVVATTNKKQQPFSYGSISGSEDFYFVK